MPLPEGGKSADVTNSSTRDEARSITTVLKIYNNVNHTLLKIDILD
jgi:hypothetical protein